MCVPLASQAAVSMSIVLPCAHRGLLGSPETRPVRTTIRRIVGEFRIRRAGFAKVHIRSSTDDVMCSATAMRHLAESFHPLFSRLVLTSFLALSATSEAASWESLHPATVARGEGVIVEHDGGLFHFNGFDENIDIENSVERYDIASDSWQFVSTTSTSGNAPTAVTHNGLVVIDDEAWFIGGRIGDSPGRVSDRVVIFDLERYSWREGPELPVPFAAGGAAVVDNRLHVFGGVDSQTRCDVSTHIVYDFDDRDAGWRNLGRTSAFPKPRNHFATVVMNDLIYAIGGQHGHDHCAGLATQREQTRYVHVYDPSFDRWTRLKDLPWAQSHAEPSTFAHAGRLWSVGGLKQGKRVLTYDPAANKWTYRRDLDLPTALFAPGARIFQGNRLHVFGGGAPNVRNPRKETWVTTVPGLNHRAHVMDSDANDTPLDDASPSETPISNTPISDTLISDTAQPVAARTAYRINIGGPALRDASNRQWSADDAAESTFGITDSRRWSTAATAEVAITDDAPPAELFKTSRTSFDRQRGLAWQLPVVPGDYEVRIHAAEMWSGAFAAGVRRFGIEIEGAEQDADVDLYARYGARQGQVLRYRVRSDALLDISLFHVKQNPAIQGLEIVALGNSTSDEPDAVLDDGGHNGSDGLAMGTLISIWRINVGGAGVLGSDGMLWIDDTTDETAGYERAASRRYSTASAVVADASVAGRVPIEVFSSERWNADRRSGLAWHLPVVPGQHEVRLYLAEIYAGAFREGARAFDILLEGDTVAEALDVYAEAGARTGIVKRFLIDSDDTLDIVLSHVTQNPALKAIEVLECTVACETF